MKPVVSVRARKTEAKKQPVRCSVGAPRDAPPTGLLLPITGYLAEKD